MDTLADDVCPLLVALTQVATVEGLPNDWLIGSAEAIGALGRQLKDVHENATGRYVCFHF